MARFIASQASIRLRRAAILPALPWRCSAPRPSAERIKDLASVQGVRNNQLVGYGLVVGLDGSGDQTTQTPFTSRASSTCWRSSAPPCRPPKRCS
jgi:flagellar basal body P-ring protein FlgI